jgi:hypothetical protein
MVDRLRAYRRWRSRKLGLLLPVFAAALATQLWLVAGSSAPAWLRVVSTGTSALVLALIGYFLAQTVLCSRLHARGNRTGARVLREHLAPSGRAALAAASLLAILNTIPYLIPADPGKPVPPTSAGRRFTFPMPGTRASALPAIESESLPLTALAESDGPDISLPQVRPIAEGLPLHLSIEDAGAAPAIPLGLGVPGDLPKQSRAARDDDGEGYPRFRPEVPDGFQLVLEEKVEWTIDRLGLPGEGNSEDWVPPELRLEVTFLNGRDHGPEFSFHVDVPVGPRESIRTSIAVAKLPGGEFLEESASQSWQRVTIAYAYRLAGYTRHSPFDLSVSVGISADRYRLEGSDGVMGDGARLSPYVAVEAALWQQGTAGLILHAGYAMPVNITGGSSGVLDLAATVRIDLSETVSLHAGYRYLLLRLRDFENALIGSRSSSSLSEEFSGPILGIDIRF